jgi:asparagine synthase (glutamine-hydrolysing)
LEDCCENLLENFQRAVKARLRSCKPVAATLSGGLDSTSVSVVAAEQLAKEGKRLRTYTHVPHFPPSRAISKNKFPDERPFAQAVADYSGNIDPVYLDSAAISPVAGVRWCLEECGMAVGTAGTRSGSWTSSPLPGGTVAERC